MSFAFRWIPIEPLELRIAPASVFTFTDVDGDVVKIRSSVGDLNAAGVVTKVTAGLGAGEQVTLIDLRDPSFQGAKISTAVIRGVGGDGAVHIGRIDATGRDLSSVTIKGDLAVIDAGDADTETPAIRLLNVRSMGNFGLITQSGGGDMVSDLQGPLMVLKVMGNLRHVHVHVVGGSDGTIGSVTVGGSLVGEGQSSGRIQASGDIGTVKIMGNIEGGRETNSGAVQSDTGSIRSVIVGGSLIGGDAEFSGVIQAFGNLGLVKIGGNVEGGAATNSARILAGDISNPGNRAVMGNITIGGSLIGGEGGFSSGRILSSGSVGFVKIGGDVRGGGIFSFNGSLDGVTVGGSLIGLAAGGAGQITSRGDMGFVKIGHDIIGSSFAGSGSVGSQGTLKGITVGGSVIGGTQISTGLISSWGHVGFVKIGGNVVGGESNETGQVKGLASIGKVSVGGSIDAIHPFFPGGITTVGDLGFVQVRGNVGSVEAGGVIESTSGAIKGVGIGGTLFGSIESDGELGPVKILRDVIGVQDANPGRIEAGADIASVTIGGSLIGALDEGNARPYTGNIQASGSVDFIKIAGDVRGAPATQTGSIFVAGDVGSLRIGGDLRGGSVSGTASGSSTGAIYVGIVNGEGGRLGKLFIGGSIIAGTDTSTGTLTQSASIQVADFIRSFTVKGSIIGNELGGLVEVRITAAGQTPQSPTTNLAFGKITIGGRVELTEILGGFSGVPQGVNGNARIGHVRVGGDWIMSSLSAGVNPGGLGFGDNGSAVIDNPAGAATDGIVARIASITIGGTVIGAPNPFFQTGFVAQQIGAFKAGGVSVALTAGTDGPILVTPYTPNVTLLEV